MNGTNELQAAILDVIRSLGLAYSLIPGVLIVSIGLFTNRLYWKERIK